MGYHTTTLPHYRNKAWCRIDKTILTIPYRYGWKIVKVIWFTMNHARNKKRPTACRAVGRYVDAYVGEV